MHRALRTGRGTGQAGADGAGAGGGSEEDYWGNFRPIVAGEGLGDTACLLLFCALVVAMLTSIAVILREPWWPGFEERGPGLLVMTCLSSILLGGATLVVDDHAPAAMIISQSPQLWMAGLRVGGFALFTSCLAIRLHAVNALYIMRAKHEPPWFFKMLIKYLMPWGMVMGLKVALTILPALYALIGMISFCQLVFLVWMMASLDRRPVVRPYNVGSLSPCYWVPCCVHALPLSSAHVESWLRCLGYQRNPDWDQRAQMPTVPNRNHVPDANAAMLWNFLMHVINAWHAIAIETELPTAAASTGPGTQAADQASAEQIAALKAEPLPDVSGRQLASTLLVLGLLLAYWFINIAPLLWQSLRPEMRERLAMELYEGPYVDYRRDLIGWREHEANQAKQREELPLHRIPTSEQQEEEQEDGEGGTALPSQAVLDRTIAALDVPPLERRKKQLDALYRWVQTVAFFNQNLADNENRREICRSIQCLRVQKGDEVVREGEAGDAFYVILRGTIGVTVNGATPPSKDGWDGTMNSGIGFGELALLNPGDIRTATCTALGEDTVLAKLSAIDYRNVIAHTSKIKLARALGAGDLEAVPKPDKPELGTMARIMGGDGYKIQLNQWYLTEDVNSGVSEAAAASTAQSHLRFTRSLRRPIFHTLKKLEAKDCGWSYAEREVEKGAVETFSGLDTDGSGMLDQDELERVLEGVLGRKVTPTELVTAMEECDQDASGFVDEYEFISWYRNSKMGKAVRRKLQYQKRLAEIGEGGLRTAMGGVATTLKAKQTFSSQGSTRVVIIKPKDVSASQAAEMV